MSSEQASGILLVVCAALAMGVSQTPLGPAFAGFWQLEWGGRPAGLHLDHSILHWINDGLMAVFFLLIGLEIEREIYTGQLSRFRTASLPFFAAFGGMLAPVLIHLAFNAGTPTQAGAGIPMATDIAFSLAVLTLLGPRVPPSMKLFLAAFAILDDLGAILVIALFYGKGISGLPLGVAAGLFLAMLAMNRLRVNRIWPYLILGLALWYALGLSGIHASIAGVLLAFAIPFAGGDELSPSTRLQHRLHLPVAFAILPVFALANSAVRLSPELLSSLSSANSLGIFLGSVAGKPLGIVLFSVLAARLGLSALPAGMGLRQLVGVGFLGGIGFTMSIFITELAFDRPDLIGSSKLTIMAASLVAGALGWWILKTSQKSPSTGK